MSTIILTLLTFIMAVQTDTSRIEYVGNNSTVTAYTVPFLFYDDSHLRVAVIDDGGDITNLTLDDDYTVTGAGDMSGGNVVTVDAWDNTNVIVIWREVPATQTEVYAELGKFPAKSHERALDKVVMLAQQFLRGLGRSLRIVDARDDIEPINPEPDTMLGFDDERLPVQKTATELALYLNAVGAPNTVWGWDGSNEPFPLTPTALATFLSLTGENIVIGQPTVTFADDGERALAVPAFAGQCGIQRDTKDVYISTGTSAGDWVLTSALLKTGGTATGRIQATGQPGQNNFSGSVGQFDALTAGGGDERYGRMFWNTIEEDIVNSTYDALVVFPEWNINLTAGRTYHVKVLARLRVFSDDTGMELHLANTSSFSVDYLLGSRLVSGTIEIEKQNEPIFQLSDIKGIGFRGTHSSVPTEAIINLDFVIRPSETAAFEWAFGAYNTVEAIRLLAGSTILVRELDGLIAPED